MNAPGNNWEKAKCADMPVSRTYDPFYSDDEEETVDAVDFCNGTIDGQICPVREHCLLFALTNNEKYGVWGGTNEITRKAIRKRYPPKRGNETRDEWTWMEEKEALKGLKKDQLLKEQEQEDE